MTPDNVYEQVRVGAFKTSTYKTCRRCRISATNQWQRKNRERQIASGRASRRRLTAEVAQIREEIKAKRAAARSAARAARQEADLNRKAASTLRSNAARRSDPATNWRDHLKNKYGLSVADYDRMLAAQSGACAACTTPLVRGNPNADNAPHVDHCHVTRKVRGILCRRCNLAVGLLRDDPNHARSVAAYLERGR